MIKLLALLALLAPAPEAEAEEEVGWGEEEGWGEEGDDAGFAEAPEIKVKAPPPPRWWRLGGTWRSDLAAWVERLDDDPWAKGRQTVEGELELEGEGWRALLQQRVAWDAALFLRRDEIDAGTWDAYALRFIGGEQYVAWDGPWAQLVVGRQIVAWGEGDMLSPLDVVNPRDNREMGLAELDEIRLPVAASRLGVFFGAHRVELMALHEAHYGERPPPKGEFSPLPKLLAEQGQAAILERDIAWDHQGEGFDLERQSALIRWVYKGPGLDLGLHAASVIDRDGTLGMPDLAALLGGGDLEIPTEHARYEVVGLSGATTFGSWLLKWEAVAELERARNVGQQVGPLVQLDEAEATLYTGMLGLTYTGIRDTTLSLEGQRGVFHEEPEDLLYPIDREILALRANRKLLNERLELQGVATLLGADVEGGLVARVEGRYEWADGLKITLGYIHYAPGDDFSPIVGLERHDRVFTRLRWDFEFRD